MKLEELHQHILFFEYEYTKLSVKLSQAIANSSCLVDNIAKKAFIIRNYISLLLNYKLLSNGTVFAGSITFSDIVIDKSVDRNNEIEFNISMNRKDVTLFYNENVLGETIALDVYNAVSGLPSIYVYLVGNKLYIYSDNPHFSYKISVSDSSGGIDYTYEEGTFEDSEDSYALYHNCLLFNDVCNIIQSANKILETKCNCN
jgi:hypothetical protein